MKRLMKLREDHKATVASMRGILEAAGDNALTVEQDKEYKGFEAKITSLNSMIEREEALAAQEDQHAAAIAAQPETVKAKVVARDLSAPPKFASLGEYAKAVADAYRYGNVDHRLYGATGHSEGVAPDGGFAVQQDFVAEITKPMYATGSVLSRCKTVDISSNSNGVKFNVVKETNRTTGNRWGGIQVFWLAEAGTLTDKKVQLEAVELNLKKVAGLYYATDELLSDASALSGLLLEAFQTELQFAVEDTVINGTGQGQPLGLLNSSVVVTQAIEATQTIANSNQFIATNAAKMRSRFMGRLQNAVWFYNIELFPSLLLAKLDSSSGAVPLFIPAGGLGDASFDRMLGIPAFPIEYALAPGTPGDLILADMSQYIVARKGGVQMDQSMHVKFLTDEMTYRIICRVDGQPIWRSAVTPYKGSLTRSPFITLNTRS